MRILQAIPSAIAYAAALAAVAAPAAFVATPAAAQSAETVLHTGTWTKVSFNARGAWSIVERDGSRFVVLSDDFRTRGAPDLKIFLSPADAGTLNGSNATDGAHLVAELSSARGGQTYEIDADVDLGDFATIMIHCEQYSKLWAVASL